MHTNRHERKTKHLAIARSSYAVNPDFGYLNSQVPDKNAFRHYLGAAAGDQTQFELQELSQNRAALSENQDFDAGIVFTETKPGIVKIEKENVSLHSSTETRPDAGLPPAKRVRVEEPVESRGSSRRVPTAEGVNNSLRISQLEQEIARLRDENKANQVATEHLIHDLQLKCERALANVREYQSRFGDLGLRTYRVECRVDQIVEHLPDHRSWQSSDFDPDETTVAFDDVSQPVEEEEWRQYYEENGLRSDVEERKGINV